MVQVSARSLDGCVENLLLYFADVWFASKVNALVATESDKFYHATILQLVTAVMTLTVGRVRDRLPQSGKGER
jgi:hypothetical protein